MPTNLIIDGHGTDLTGSFNFVRSQGNECTLYSYVRTGIPIRTRMSDDIIAQIIAGNNNKQIAMLQQSRIGGTQITDRLLGAIQLDSKGQPEWNNDAAINAGVSTNIQIAGVNAVQIVGGGNTYLRLQVGIHNTVKLSDIISHYAAGQYNIYWCVCR